MPFATQTALQAGEPINVNVDYDVPAFSPEDASRFVQEMDGASETAALEASAGAQGLQVGSVTAEAKALDGTRASDQAASFLAAKVLPIDAGKIKNSLYVTQSMRSPPQASVNVIMREDIEELQRKVKYEGMKEQTARLKEYVRSRFAA